LGFCLGHFQQEVVGGPTYDAHAGDVVTIEPHIPHTFRHIAGSGTGTFSCIHLELSRKDLWMTEGYRCAPLPQPMTHTHGDPAIHDLFRRAAEAYGNYSRYRDELVRTIVKEIWVRLSEYWETGEGTGPSVRIQEMMAYLRKNVTRPVGRHDLAGRFSITPEHVDHLFRKEIGLTPTDFLQQERIQLAHKLLRYGGCSVKEAAARSGFNDQFYFSRVFKKLMKMPPSEVRKRENVTVTR